MLSASADSTARIWRAGENNTYSAVHTLKVGGPYSSFPSEYELLVYKDRRCAGPMWWKAQDQTH